MQAFAALYDALDASTSNAAKLRALRAYLAAAPADDAAWGLYCLAGGRPRQAVPTAVLRQAACNAAGLPDWLFEASYQAVGDLAETIAHLLPPPSEPAPPAGLAEWMRERLPALRGQPPDAQAATLQGWWAGLDTRARFLLVKLIGGGFRVGVSKLLVQRALAEHAGLDAKLVAQRMVGWTSARAKPGAAALAALLAPPGQGQADAGAPYPFFLAQPLAGEPQALGDAAHWLAEWKYDGIRAQLVRRAGGAWLWSRGEELINEPFPELVAAAQAQLPAGTVLDGELLVWPAGAEVPAPFQRLQQRLNRKTVTAALQRQAPLRFIAYDLLEVGGQDLRALPQAQRRQQLQALLATLAPPFMLSPLLPAGGWPTLAAWREGSRARGVEGLMLKHHEARYGSGRSNAEGAWFKWKVQPYTVDAVLLYAQAGHGRRASVYTDYTFAVWSRAPADAAEAQAVAEAIAARQPPEPGALQLVTFTKAYSGLTDDEFAAVDKVVRADTINRFGPVRSVRPRLVFELGFEGIAASTRHKCGVALRFPRMLRLRPDKALHQADTLASLQALLSCGPTESPP